MFQDTYSMPERELDVISVLIRSLNHPFILEAAGRYGLSVSSSSAIMMMFLPVAVAISAALEK